MKKTHQMLLFIFLIFSVNIAFSKGVVSVRGYFKKNGTYVPPHYRSSPDGNFYNNWSTKGNKNPYTEKEGTKNNNYNSNYQNHEKKLSGYEPNSFNKNNTPKELEIEKNKITNTKNHLDFNDNKKSNIVNEEYLFWLNKSNESLNNKNWTEAIRTSSVAIELNKNIGDAYVNRSWAYIEKGFLDKAINDCDNAIKLESSSFLSAINNKGLALYRQGKIDDAVINYRIACDKGLDISCQNFKEIFGYFPNEEKNIFMNESIKFFNQKNYVKSIEYSEKVLSIDSSNSEAYSNICGSYAFLNKLNDAKIACEKAIKIDPNFSMSYNNNGFIFEVDKNFNEAILFYEMGCNLGNSLACENKNRLSIN